MANDQEQDPQRDLDTLWRYSGSIALGALIVWVSLWLVLTYQPH